MLSKCVWSHWQIYTVKIWQHFALFSLQKFGSTLPQMHHSTQNDILTKLSTWECGNKDALFSQWKSGRVLRLVCYGALTRFHVCVYDAYRHDRTVTSWSRSKHQACWCMLHTQGNQCHFVTWFKAITPRWSYTQYSMIMHLWQLPWARTHTTRSRALTTREGHSCSHKCLSYKVHNHPYTSKYRYTNIMHNATTQSRKVNQTLPMLQGNGPTSYKKCKIDIAIP